MSHDAHNRPATAGTPGRRVGGAVALGAAALVAAAIWAVPRWQHSPGGDEATRDTPATSTGARGMPKIAKTDAEWRDQLDDEQYYVTRQKGTERPFSGQYWNTKDAGRYKCVCCGAELFTSETKYDSGCGWPSFFAASQPDNVHTDADHSHGMVRIEVQCKQCGAHLGHLFDDGPQPTGQRYCMNSAALAFEKKPEGEPPDSESPK